MLVWLNNPHVKISKTQRAIIPSSATRKSVQIPKENVIKLPNNIIGAIKIEKFTKACCYLEKARCTRETNNN